jgi:hypothetical protein
VNFHYTLFFDHKRFNRWFEEEIIWSLHYFWIYRPKSFYRELINSTYYRLKLGFNPKDIWSLDYSIANYILPRLKYLKKTSRGHPSNLTERQWKRELDKMIAAFTIIVDGAYYDFGSNRHMDQKIIDDGLDSFRKHYHNLWD